ncbi:MAG: signal peptidase I [Actinobacteria bacterium]|jgi:signal peptidase|nr:MAG: signal peptidase I [Actinomycetota bacterium]
MLPMGTSHSGDRKQGAIWSREISFKYLRGKHRAAYYILVGSAWAVMGFFLSLFLLLLFSALNPWIHARVIISGSMEPTIRTGSMVIVIPQDEYHPGDIISFTDPVIGRNVHRIVGEVGGDDLTYFVTKGDAAERPDRIPVPIDKIEGKVVMIFPYLGYAAYLGFFATLVPLSMIIFHFIRKRRDEGGVSKIE